MRVSHAHACTHTIPTEPCVPLDARETSLFYPQSSHFQSQPTALHTWTSGNRSEGCLGPVRPEEWQTLLPPKPTENPFTNMTVTNDTSLQNKSGTSCCLVQTLCGHNQSRASSFPALACFPYVCHLRYMTFLFCSSGFDFLVTSKTF